MTSSLTAGLDNGEMSEESQGNTWKCKQKKTSPERAELESSNIKIDDCEMNSDTFLLSKSNGEEAYEAASPSMNSKDSDTDAVGWLNSNESSTVPLLESGNEVIDDLTKQNNIDITETKFCDVMSSDRIILKDRQITEEIEKSDEKDEVMSVDNDEMFTVDSEKTVINSNNFSHGSSNNSSHSVSPGAKRGTLDDDDEESPKPKRQTPDRSDDRSGKDETPNSWKDSDVTNVTDPDQSSKELPDLSSDSDDDDDLISTPAAQRRLFGRLRRKPRLSRRLRSSSDESDTTDDNDDNEEVKSDDEKESDEDVKKATMEILNKPLPKPNWFAVRELRNREYGTTSHQSTSCFRERVQGSLQMVKRLVLKESLKAHEGCVNALSFNRIGTLLASGSDDLNIVLWNWQRARPSLIYDSGHRSNVFQAKFMPYSGDCHVISCARDGQVRLAELSLTGVCKATRKLAQHRGAAHKLALELDSPNVFLSCGEDAVTYLFDLREERPHKLVTTKENEKKVALYSIHSNPCDSRQFCVGGRDHYIRVYDKRKIAEDADGGVLKKFCPDHLVDSDVKANVTCACYNYNGTEILGSYNDEDIYLFDNTMSDGANYVHKYTGHRNNATVKGVNFYGPKSEFVVSGSDCGHVYFWEKETEAIVNFQEGDEAGVINVLEPHPTLPVLATSGLDHDVKLWMPTKNVPHMDVDVLKKTLWRNHKERAVERVSSEPEMIGGQMLWFIMHHFRNSARRRMREEGQMLSSSDENSDSHSEDSDTNELQCAQS